MNKKLLNALRLGLLILVVMLLLAIPSLAAVGPTQPALPGTEAGDTIPGGPGTSDPNINISLNGEGSDVVRILLLLTVLSVLPSVLLMMTCFTRIVIVFSLLRNAMSLQQTPPNQVMVGLSLFLTLFIMRPVISDINENAYIPYSQGEISATEFIEEASSPLRDFMLKQTKREDLNLFLTVSGAESWPESVDAYSMAVVIPAFIVSEIKRAFTIGFLIYIPFLIIDMVVASALMSMGMMMLPPATISMPFKLMLFVMVDGWGLMVKTLISTYNL